jgi:hypothetical protein
MRREHRRLDWDGVTEHEGKWRVVGRWVTLPPSGQSDQQAPK